LLAFAALTSPTLGPRQCGPAMKVITCGVGFPDDREPHSANTAACPVFIDAHIRTYK